MNYNFTTYLLFNILYHFDCQTGDEYRSYVYDLEPSRCEALSCARACIDHVPRKGDITNSECHDTFCICCMSG